MATQQLFEDGHVVLDAVQNLLITAAIVNDADIQLSIVWANAIFFCSIRCLL